MYNEINAFKSADTNTITNLSPQFL